MGGEATATEIEVADADKVNSATDNMDLTVDSEANAESNGKRVREEGDKEADAASKKQKADKSVEEERLEDLEGEEDAGHKKDCVTAPVSLGPKKFGTSVEMFDYFFKLLHHWPTDLNINKYEEMVLMDLLKKGHAEPDNKIGVGIQAFQVRVHPTWKSRCFFLIRDDGSSDDFSFRKCVDHILPLPEDMKVKTGSSKGGGGGGKWRGGGRGGGRGRGRGGKR